ncbi:MAG: NUDIX hydrolase [Actinobacteria bacterium]|nr:NUDIX hydrolase [Actinomycetota bacterium]
MRGERAERAEQLDASGVETPESPFGVTVDVAVLTVRHGQLAALLVERKYEPFRFRWALPGGFVRVDEELEDAARRELAEETGLVLGPKRSPRGVPSHLEQLRTYGAPDRDPRRRVVSVGYLAMIADVPRPEAGSDAATARYWAASDLCLPRLGQRRGTKLAFDHAEILADAVERARAKLEYTTLATAFVDETFTLGELRRVYEVVWGEELHEANFRRKLLSTPGFVEPTGTTAPTDGRPAQLFRNGGATTLHPPILRG